MISLFVDTALSFIRIALFCDDELLDFINEKCEKNMSSFFDIYVKRIFDRNNLSLSDVKKIYSVIGPGSFTGIRVGMTFSKILALSQGIKITPISELQVIASTESNSDLRASIIDARRGYVYAAVYDSDLNVVANGKYVFLTDFLNTNRNVDYFSYDSFEHISVKTPEIDFQKIINKNKSAVQIDYHVLTPNYLKLTEAEENLRRKIENDS